MLCAVPLPLFVADAWSLVVVVVVVVVVLVVVSVVVVVPSAAECSAGPHIRGCVAPV